METKSSSFFKKANYELLKNWCLSIYDFYLKYDRSTESVFMINLFKDAINRIDKTKDIKQMRALFKETNELFREDMLSKELMDKLNERLFLKFGHNIADEINSERLLVRKIVERNKICDNKEFNIVKRHEEEIYADDSQQEYAEVLRNLLADYEGNNALHNNDGISGDSTDHVPVL